MVGRKKILKHLMALMAVIFVLGIGGAAWAAIASDDITDAAVQAAAPTFNASADKVVYYYDGATSFDIKFDVSMDNGNVANSKVSADTLAGYDLTFTNNDTIAEDAIVKTGVTLKVSGDLTVPSLTIPLRIYDNTNNVGGGAKFDLVLTLTKVAPSATWDPTSLTFKTDDPVGTQKTLTLKDVEDLGGASLKLAKSDDAAVANTGTSVDLMGTTASGIVVSADTNLLAYPIIVGVGSTNAGAEGKETLLAKLDFTGGTLTYKGVEVANAPTTGALTLASADVIVQGDAAYKISNANVGATANNAAPTVVNGTDGYSYNVPVYVAKSPVSIDVMVKIATSDDSTPNVNVSTNSTGWAVTPGTLTASSADFTLSASANHSASIGLTIGSQSYTLNIIENTITATANPSPLTFTVGTAAKKSVTFSSPTPSTTPKLAVSASTPTLTGVALSSLGNLFVSGTTFWTDATASVDITATRYSGVSITTTSSTPANSDTFRFEMANANLVVLSGDAPLAKVAGVADPFVVSFDVAVSSGSGSGGSGGTGGGTGPGPGGSDPGTDPGEPEEPTPGDNAGITSIDLGTSTSGTWTITPADLNIGEGITVARVDSVNPTDAQQAEMEAMGITMEVVNGNLVITLNNPTKVGVLDIPITVTATNGEQYTATYRIWLQPILATGTDIDVADPTQTTVTLTGSSANPAFTVRIPTNVTAADGILANAYTGTYGITTTGTNITVSGNTFVVSGTSRATGVPFEVTGTKTGTDMTGATIDSISYTVGTTRYTQAVNLDLSKATITDNTTETPSEGGSSSSGCDAGFGAFALIAAAGAVALRKKD